MRPEAELPSYDRSEFKESAQSIARADLLACRNPDARFTRGSDASIEEFAKQLHGTWIGHRRSVHGMPVETDLVFLIDLRGARGSAILIDRNNLETVMEPAFLGRLAEGPVEFQGSNVFTYVDCTFEFVDQFVKVSDDVSIPRLARATGVPLRGARNLRQAWDQLVEAGYFNGFRMPLSGKAGDVREIQGAVLGDRSRVAVLPGGITVTEREIAAGRAPGAEYQLPMVTGGIFDITVELVRPEGRRHSGIYTKWDAVYRGAGINIPPGEAVTGVEYGLFLKEGNAYVSATSEMGSEAWTTSACGDKNGLDALSAVSNPDPTHADHAHENFVFTRVVLGNP